MGKLIDIDRLQRFKVKMSEITDALNNNKVSKSGDTMTGALELATTAGNGAEVIKLGQTAGSTEFAICKVDSNAAFRAIGFRQYCPSGTYRENYYLPPTTDDLTANVNYDILTTKDVIVVPQGGTGETTVAGVKNAFGISALETGKVDRADTSEVLSNNYVILGAGNAAVKHAKNAHINTTVGTTSIEGEEGLVLGNNIKTGVAGNLTGNIAFYGATGYYHRLITDPSTTGNRGHYLPNATGWLVTGGNGSTTGVGSENVPVYVGTNGVAAPISILSVANGGTGLSTIPSGEALIGNGTGAVTTRAIRNSTTFGNIGWTSNDASNALLTQNDIAYWNGRYGSSASNLQYCKLGEFGSMAVKSADDYLPLAGGTLTGPLTLSALNAGIDIQRGNLHIGGDTNYRGITIKGGSGSPLLHIRNTGARLTFDQYANGSAGGERYLLPTPETRSADAWYSILTTKNVITVAQGGTGATSLAGGQALIGNGTGAVKTRAITDVTSGAATASTNLVTANTLVSHVANKLGDYLPLTGGTMTDRLYMTDESGIVPASNGYGHLTFYDKDKNWDSSVMRAPDHSLRFVLRSVSTNNYEQYILPVPDANRAQSTYYNILTTKPAESVYTRLCPGVDLTTTPSSQSNNDVIRFYDKNSKGFGYIGGTQYTNGQTNVIVSAYRTVGGTTVYNGLTLGVTPEKKRVVTFSDVNVWRSALLMLYKAGDTYSESSSALNGIIGGGGKLFALRVTLPKSLQNISNISVTALKGWIASSAGIIDSSTDSTNWITKSGVTVRASKKDNNTLLIVLETSTVLSNAVVGACGALISFTLSFS